MGCTLKKEDQTESVTLNENKKKIVIIGLENSGKTSILYKLLNCEMISSKNLTACVNIENYRNNNQDLLIFDLSGKAIKLWGHYFNNLDGLIFVIDASNPASFKQVKSEFMQLIDIINNQKSPILIYLNKFDNFDTFEQDIDLEFLEDSLEVDTIIQKCSAKTGQGVDIGLQKLMKMVQNKKTNNSETPNNILVNLQQ